VIFAAIAIAWLAYLVPHFVRRRGDDQETAEADPAERFSENVHIVRNGTAPLLDQDLEPIAEYEVSTPMTRRAAIADLRQALTEFDGPDGVFAPASTWIIGARAPR